MLFLLYKKAAEIEVNIEKQRQKPLFIREKKGILKREIDLTSSSSKLSKVCGRTAKESREFAVRTDT